uniref:Uncharacterized protein n=1 Tax=Tetraselmis sp. GSL018 TaxID=582737 RepID=A0A061RMT8_9CHLO
MLATHCIQAACWRDPDENPMSLQRSGTNSSASVVSLSSTLFTLCAVSSQDTVAEAVRMQRPPLMAKTAKTTSPVSTKKTYKAYANLFSQLLQPK